MLYNKVNRICDDDAHHRAWPVWLCWRARGRVFGLGRPHLVLLRITDFPLIKYRSPEKEMRVISQPQSPAPQQGQRRSPSPAPLPLPPGGLNVKLQSVAAKAANGAATMPPEQQENGTESLLRAQDRRVVADTVAQAAWAEKKWVWVEHPAEGYVAAHVVEESGADGEQLTVEFTDGKVVICFIQ